MANLNHIFLAGHVKEKVKLYTTKEKKLPFMVFKLYVPVYQPIHSYSTLVQDDDEIECRAYDKVAKQIEANLKRTLSIGIRGSLKYDHEKEKNYIWVEELLFVSQPQTQYVEHNGKMVYLLSKKTIEKLRKERSLPVVEKKEGKKCE
jgi:hypothetical protein